MTMHLDHIDASAPAASNDVHGGPAVDHPSILLVFAHDEYFHLFVRRALDGVDEGLTRIRLLHAYTEQETRVLAAANQHITTLLLSVSQANADHVLDLLHHVRHELRLRSLRIIMRFSEDVDPQRFTGFDIAVSRPSRDWNANHLAGAVSCSIIDYWRAVRADMPVQDARHPLQNAPASREANEIGICPWAEKEGAAELLRLLGVLTGTSPDGMVVVRNKRAPASALSLLSAAGRYADPTDVFLPSRIDPLAGSIIAAAIEQKDHLYTRDMAALYLAGDEGTAYVALLYTSKHLDLATRQLLGNVCANIGIGLKNAVVVAKLQQFAFVDLPTGLANRIRLTTTLDELLCTDAKRGKALTLIEVEYVSKPAYIAQSLEDDFGELVIQAIAGRLAEATAGCMLLARRGMIQFAILGPASHTDPVKIQRVFEPPFDVAGKNVHIRATLGLLDLTSYGGTATNAVQDASTALHGARATQRSGHLYYSDSTTEEVRSNITLLHGLRNALERRELSVAYQPQIDLSTNEVTGVEALMRWTTRDGMAIPPSQFIPVADHSGLIIRLGEWMMRKACMKLTELHRDGFDTVSMAINISYAQLRHPQFLDTFTAVLEQTGVSPAFVELEITDAMVMNNSTTWRQSLEYLRRLGVRISLDDFGAKPTSLNGWRTRGQIGELGHIGIDKLKIDRAFVKQMTESAHGGNIAEQVVQLGKRHNLQVTAEGIDDPRQVDMLTQLGCGAGQGYLFAKPMTPDQLHPWLTKNRLRAVFDGTGENGQVNGNRERKTMAVR
jgi:diguanylate cyclase